MYLTYRNQIISRNISFAKLGSEDCEVCLEHKEHICTTTDENCQICITYEPHLMAERKSREEYISDKVIINNLNTSIFSVEGDNAPVPSRCKKCGIYTACYSI